MSWPFVLVVVAVVVVMVILKKSGQISPAVAREHLKAGALVVDVRSLAEYESYHLPGVMLIPLDQIETELPKRVADKSRVLLLHCASGMRSGMAAGKLKSLGYTNVFNLGGYDRAATILQARP